MAIQSINPTTGELLEEFAEWTTEETAAVIDQVDCGLAKLAGDELRRARRVDAPGRCRTAQSPGRLCPDHVPGDGQADQGRARGDREVCLGL